MVVNMIPLLPLKVKQMSVLFLARFMVFPPFLAKRSVLYRKAKLILKAAVLSPKLLLSKVSKIES